MIPGFNIVLDYASWVPLEPEDAYFCAIEFLYDLASAGWEEVIPSGYEAFSPEVNGIKIAFASVTQPEDIYQLQSKHLILGVLKAMNSLASRKSFCTTKATLYMYNKPFGQLAIGRGARQPPTLSRIHGTNVTLSNSDPIHDNTASRSLAVVREIVDPEDSDFVISYEMLEDPIPCQTLLNAAMNGMAKSAQLKNDARCIDFAGYSSAGEVTYMISRNPPGTTRFVLTYSLVRTTLKLLPERLYSAGTCGEVKFDFVYQGDELGGGTFFLS